MKCLLELSEHMHGLLMSNYSTVVLGELSCLTRNFWLTDLLSDWRKNRGNYPCVCYLLAKLGC
jgi:hypothetical protein